MPAIASMMVNVRFDRLGIDLDINKEIFSIGSFSVRWYGLLIAIGFALAVWYCTKRAPKFGILPDDLIDMLLVCTPAAVIGARLYYVAFNWSQFADDPVSVLYIWNGGIAIYGAVIAGLIAAAVFCKVKKLNILNFLDIAVLGLLIGQAVGRWGNFVNGEVFGVECGNMLLGMTVDNFGPVHPLFLYESLWNIAGFAMIHFLSKKRYFYGQNLALYVAWYGVGRGLLEGIRAEQDVLYLFGSGIRVSQMVGFVSALLAVGFIVYKLLLSDRGDPVRLLSKEGATEAMAARRAQIEENAARKKHGKADIKDTEANIAAEEKPSDTEADENPAIIEDDGLPDGEIEEHEISDGGETEEAEEGEEH